MPVINNPFNGKLNLDVAEYRIQNGDYIDALNITRDAQGIAQDKVVSNIIGNQVIANTLPSGENKIIGFYADKIRNRAYYFLWNSNGYNSILYYDLSTEVIVKVLTSKTDSDGIDILSFNPSYKVLSVNIFYRDDEGDLLFFNDGLNPPKVINVSDNYGTSWKLEYILVSKAPPVMPAKVVYENDTTITVNNLRNKLFQFCYRYVYDNNEKSVWSSKSIVPLPQQPSLNFTENTATNNARIAVLFSTGGIDVRAIELSFRETTNGVTSDWYLIKSFDKQALTISDNIVYDYKFYNDGIYTQIDVLESSQLQDYVPQKANAAELGNGNVLLYSGITEGYDKTDMELSIAQYTNETAYYYDQAGLLFFASVNGADNGSGTSITFYLYGTGTNGGNGTVTTLNNAAGGYYVNIFATDGTDLSTSYSTSGITTSYTVNSILTGLSAAMVLKGFTQTSLVGNKLIMSLSSGFVLTSTGFKTFPVLDNDNTRFASVWDSGYQYAVQYFDAQGRTIGAQTAGGGTINTPSRVLTSNFPTIYLSIENRPPLYASYYQVLRSNNTTYNKRLCWISESAYSGITSATDNQKYIYIGIGNISAYNESISSTQNVVSYNYTEGDRIKFIRRYDVNNDPVSLSAQYDYEIVGTVSTFEYNISYPSPIAPDNNTYTATGNFLKIKYPTADISATFDFPGTADFQHYEILLYNYTSNFASDQRFFYEFGKEYGIGNPGTADRYHFGVTQLPNGGAVIPVTNGDLFYRLRNVPYSDNFNYRSTTFEIATPSSSSETFPITVTPTIDNTSYKIQTQANATAYIAGSGFPVWASSGFLFYNKSSSAEKILSINGSLQVTPDVNSEFSVYAIICTNLSPYEPKYWISLLPLESNSLVADVPTIFEINKKFSVPPTGKVWLVATYSTIAGGNLVLQPFDFEFDVVKNTTIEIIESSFSDNYNLITNSNGRPSVVDENAKQTYFPTLIRFGGAYQINTNINQINNFKYENFDEYDRSFGDVMRLHVRDRYLKVYQKFKVGNVPILTQIVKDSANNPLQANTDTLINKIQYYAGDYGIGDASTSLAWNNFADYFVDNYRGVVCRLSQDGITPLSILYATNAFFVPLLQNYRQELNNGISSDGSAYEGNPCIYGVFDAYTNKYIIAMEEINRYITTTTTTTTTAGPTTTTTTAGPTTTTTTAAPITTTTTFVGTTTTTTTTTTLPPFTANIATTDAYDACNNPELINLVFYGNGTNACDSTSVTISATLAAYLSDSQPFYINDRVDGVFYSSYWTRVGSTLIANRTTACIECVSPSTTTTTSAPIITTTTTTTTLAPVDFGGSAGCSTGSDGAITITSFTGGSGVYQATSVTYATQLEAEAGTFTDVSSIRTYSGLTTGTFWVALRDKNNTSNKLAKPFTVTVCPTTTTTLSPITLTATPSCDGSGFNGQGRVTASSFSGGTGSYTLAAIGTSESNAIACINNPSCPERVSIVGLTSYAWTSLSNGPYYVAIKDTGVGLGLSSLATVSCNATTTTTTTSTTTTTLAPVNFSTSGGCSTGSNGTGTMVSFSGGSGVYQASSTTYADSTSAENGSYTDVTSIRQFTGLSVGTYWVALRDKNNTSNKIAKSFTITPCPTTTTTLSPITYTLTPTCSGTSQDILINNLAGGNGTYYMSTTTYGDAGAALSGPVSLVIGGSRLFNSQASGTRYVLITAGNGTLASGGTTCTTTTAAPTTTTTSTTTTTTAAPVTYRYLATDCYTGTGTIYSSTSGTLNGITIQTSTACFSLTLAVMGTAVGPLPAYTQIPDCINCGI